MRRGAATRLQSGIYTYNILVWGKKWDWSTTNSLATNSFVARKSKISRDLLDRSKILQNLVARGCSIHTKKLLCKNIYSPYDLRVSLPYRPESRETLKKMDLPLPLFFDWLPKDMVVRGSVVSRVCVCLWYYSCCKPSAKVWPIAEQKRWADCGLTTQMPKNRNKLSA